MLANAVTWDHVTWPPPTSTTDVVATVPVSATVTTSPPTITLNFIVAGKYQILRKDPAATTWGAALVTLPAAANTWTDTNVSAGQFYEYKLIYTDGPTETQVPNPITFVGGTSPPIGYILTGINVDETQPRGRVVLVVTTDVQANLPNELAQYQADLAADGWFVHVVPIAPATDYTSNGTGANDTNGIPTAPYPTTHITLRNNIKAIYNAYPGEVKNVILLGKVPACRTGSTFIGDPDGHQVNDGATGADGYYANMTGTWTDTGTNLPNINQGGITAASGEINVAGDNKFDQYYMSQTGGQADMGFGRIDLSNNIAGQYEALKFYLGKLHRFKTASADFQPGRRVIMRTGSFPNIDETCWTCAYGITGDKTKIDCVSTTALPTQLSPSFDADAAYSAANGPYLLYFKGSGAPVVGVGGKAAFWTGMQSHWGWWYSSSVSSGENDPALRLGEDSYGLSWTWSIFGLRYFYHRMAMGFDAGDMMRVSINNVDAVNGTYANTTDTSGFTYIQPCAGALFMNHFGDPTLRFFMFAPPTGLSVVPVGGQPGLSWIASTEPTVIGYHVYRAAMASGTVTGPYQRLTTSLVAGTAYTDIAPAAGTGTGQWSYMVRAIRLETTGSGTYFNASLGAIQSIDQTNAPTTLQITTGAVLPTAYWNTTYLTTLAASGGTPLFVWAVVSGTLPPGLTLSANGAFLGQATKAGNYSFTAKVTDALGQTAQQAFTITVQSNNTITLLPEATAYNYSTAPTRIQGPTEIMNVSGASNIQNSLLRYNLSGLGINNSFVSAKLRLYVAPGTTANCIALVQAALTADAGVNWNASTVTYNTQPADNSSVAPAIATTFPVPYSYVDIDVTTLMTATLSNYSSGKIGFRLFTPSTQLVTLCSGYSYGGAISQLIIQTTNAPKISIASPTVNPTYLYAGSGLQISATATAIPATAASLTTQWSQVSGPGTSTFSSPMTPSTTVTFSSAGDYVLRLSANDGVLQSYQNLTVRVLTVPVTGPADSSLKLRLPFDAGTGAIALDASGVTPPNSGTLINSSTWTTSGRFGGALSFGGSGQRVDVPDSATNLLDSTPQMSFSMWVYANSLPVGTTVYSGLLCKRLAAFNKESYTIQLRGSAAGTSSPIYADIGGGATLVSAAQLTPGKWYHIAMVFDGTAATNKLQLYINGGPDKFQTITPTSVPRNSTANLHIGALDSADVLGFNGLIDEVRIYSRALTLSEVQDLYAGAPANMGPVISTAATLSGNAGQALPLSATVTDDGKPGPLTLGWSQLSGPMTLSIANPSAASTTTTPMIGGTFGLQFTASDGAITTWANTMATIVLPPGIATWRATYFGTVDASGNHAELANPAGDGLPNLMKYALGLNPNISFTPGTAGLAFQVHGIGGQNYLTYTFTGTAPDVTYTVEATSDLNGAWTPLYSHSGSAPGTTAVQDAPVPGNRFIRLRVTNP